MSILLTKKNQKSSTCMNTDKIQDKADAANRLFFLHREKAVLFMLGTSAGAEQKNINDFCGAADYINYLFTGIKGWICRSQINPGYKQDMYRFNGLLGAGFDDLDNVYISMNTFYRNERTVECLKRLNALYVDIDCYKMGLDKHSVLERLEDDYYEKIIPCPTFVIDSGRGLYLVWKLQNEDRNALPRWTRVQRYLTDTLQEFGADPVCKDAARILRVPFSTNTKSDTRVEILQFYDVTYKIRDIELEYNITYPKSNYKRPDGEKTHPYNTATEPMRRYASDLAFKLGVALPDFNDYKATQEWIAEMRTRTVNVNNVKNEDGCVKKTEKMHHILNGYCHDIETLFKIRQGEDCKREVALFLYRLFTYDMTKDKELALTRTLELNASFSCPFSEKYVTSTTKSAERKIDKGDTYHYKRETIIEILDITAEEMKKLVYLTDADCRRERKKERNKKYYEEHLAEQGKESKKESMAKRRDAVSAMQKDGKSAGEIMQELGISKATYYRIRAEIAAGRAVDAAKEAVKETVEAVKKAVCRPEEDNGENAGADAGKDGSESMMPVVSQKLSPIIIKALRSNAATLGGLKGGIVDSG